MCVVYPYPISLNGAVCRTTFPTHGLAQLQLAIRGLFLIMAIKPLLSSDATSLLDFIT